MTTATSYRIRRSTFVAPTVEQILTGPVVTDATGLRFTTGRFTAAKDGRKGGPTHAGLCGLKQSGFVFFPEKPTELQEGAEVVGEALDSLSLPDLFELAGLAFTLYAESKSGRTARDFLGDPRTFVVPFLDVTEVAVSRVDRNRVFQDLSPYEVLVTCEDGSGQPLQYRFRERGRSWAPNNSDDLAAAIATMRIINDLDAAQEEVARRENDRYTAQAREDLTAQYGDLEGREDLIAAQARQLRRQAAEQSGTTVAGHVNGEIRRLLQGLLPDYERLIELRQGMADRYRTVLSSIVEG